MNRDDNKIEVKKITQVVGFGQTRTIGMRTLRLSEEESEHDAFAASFVEDNLEYDGKSYNYYDSLREHFVQGENHYVFFYLRYCLDVEKENFKTFLEEAMPGDVLKEPASDNP